MAALNIACGTYDGSVFVLKCDLTKNVCDGVLTALPILLDPSAHPGSVSALATSGDLVASGGPDDVIQVFSLHDRTRLGSLDMHVGTVRKLVFAPSHLDIPDDTHLLSASDDGSICIWRCDRSSGSTSRNSWECVRQMRRHKGAVQCLEVHNSGRVAFSTGADKTMRVWNLLRGRQAYALSLKNLADKVEGLMVSPTGRRLIFHWPNRYAMVDFFPQDPSAATMLGGCLGDVKFEHPLTAPPVFFSEDDEVKGKHEIIHPNSVFVLVGCSNLMKVFRCPLHTSSVDGVNAGFEQLSEVRLPGKRVKFIQVLPWPSMLTSDDESVHPRCRLVVVVTTDPDGSHIRGYRIDLRHSCDLHLASTLKPVLTYDLEGARVTALDAGWYNNLETAEPTEIVKR